MAGEKEQKSHSSGPLAGLRILECVGLGPGPFAGMMLADMGAEVIAIDKPFERGLFPHDINRRGKKTIFLDLKSTAGQEAFVKLAQSADALFEGFRPNVMERLNLGPERLLKEAPHLVYGRMTGWGQTGPKASEAGHDLNYIALTGALDLMTRPYQAPPVPLNLIGDYGGGGMMLAFGLLAAILHAKETGQGQVIDVSMMEGTQSLLSIFHSFRVNGLLDTPSPDHARQQALADAASSDHLAVNIPSSPLQRGGTHFLAGAAHFYGTYVTKDGGAIALGAIEPAFMAMFLEKMALPLDWLADHMDQSLWPARRAVLAARFLTKNRDEWADIFAGSDACVTPVLNMAEAIQHPHATSRESFITVDGHIQQAPAPRFSLTPACVRHGPRKPGSDTQALLSALGLDADSIKAASGARSK